MKFQDDISNMNTYVRTYIHTYIRTSRNQYVPYFFKVGGITTALKRSVMNSWGLKLVIRDLLHPQFLKTSGTKDLLRPYFKMD